jgi:hypothetical protein
VSRILFALLAFAFLAAGCATKPSDSYAALLSTTRVEPVDSILRSPRDGQLLELGVEHKVAISQQEFVTEHAGVRGNYQLLQLRSVKPGGVKLHVESICDCLGLEKYVVLPKLFLATNTGSQVAPVLLSQLALEPTMSKRARVQSTWLVDLPAAGTYTVMLMADNSRVGQVVASLAGTTSISGGVPGVLLTVPSKYDLKIYPFGNLVVRVE